MLVIAHRTCPRHALENSVQGIGVAAELGADLVEVDVRMTRRGDLVLAHDAFPLRLARHRGRRSTSLANALSAATTAGIGIAFDIKEDRAALPLADRVGAAGLRRGFLWTRSSAVAFALVAHSPEVEVGLVSDRYPVDDAIRFLDDAARSGAGAVSAAWEMIDVGFRRAATERSLRVYGWCPIRAQNQFKHDLLDGIVTDWPEDVA
jgi:hypothetical protein